MFDCLCGIADCVSVYEYKAHVSISKWKRTGTGTGNGTERIVSDRRPQKRKLRGFWKYYYKLVKGKKLKKQKGAGKPVFPPSLSLSRILFLSRSHPLSFPFHESSLAKKKRGKMAKSRKARAAVFRTCCKCYTRKSDPNLNYITP